ncbi:beta-mannosidase [Sanguibacter gelidistatuariae]|uniref:beta-mannosidase n=1 Tax=Sanguibacter gelidistatuariae TaxID=1814289 RepID=A0A1G6GVA8_9MICO|nr:glycoside hydrolase family 2 protein [Sanguibacter gelidistatuariae]SDB85908.1 beta-mannosidase [Sanguibacter gelidistatuariae]
MLSTKDLTDDWVLRVGVPDGTAPQDVELWTVPATVPGSVHTDLLAQDLIADPYLDRNEDQQHWIGRSTWEYRTTFQGVADGTRHELAFDGLDTVASIEVNGTHVASTANMHREYRFDVTHLVRSGANDLVVVFGSAYDYAEQVRRTLGDRPNVYPEPFQYIRKMASNFGWDWGPTLVTAGIWKMVRLETWTTARLGGVRPFVRIDGADGVVEVHVEVERAPGTGGQLVLDVEVAGVRATATLAPGATQAVVEVRVPDVDVWWPLGYGDQPLYNLTVGLGSGDAELDVWTRRIGFRTVELQVEPDDAGTSFAIVVNGESVFVRGANWIPDDCFVARVGADRYRTRVDQAVGANINLLRIWGGGIYEKDEFYDACDEAGVLVWQDFLFACAAYPEGEPLRSEVEGEARDNVRRLMPHPSLVLWNGNNENIWGFEDWDWKEPLAGRDWGGGYYFDLLPEIVAEIDPTRPYWPGSPYSGSADLHPNDPNHGNHHSWEVWNRQDYATYADDRPRFVSEFGFQGPPQWATIERSVHDQPLAIDSPGMLHHQRADDGNGKLARGMAPHLPEPHDVEEWHYLTQLNQARAVTFAIEHYRALWPHCMGSIVWQLNDCWPVTSWAAIDGDGRRKPLWYALRRVYDDRLVVVHPSDGGGLEVVVVNDAPHPWTGDLVVERMALDGTVLDRFTVAVDASARASVQVALPPAVARAVDEAGEVLVATLGDRRAVRPFAEDVALRLVDPGLRTVVRETKEGVAVEVHATGFARDLVLAADRVAPGAEVDDQLVTLLPGESHTFHVRTTVAADDPRWYGAHVLFCVNDVKVSHVVG